MIPVTTGIIGIIVLLILLFSRMPIGFVMGLVGFAGFANQSSSMRKKLFTSFRDRSG